MLPEGFNFGDFDSPGKCDVCREEIPKDKQGNRFVLHIRIVPKKVLNEAGQVIGFEKQKGPRNRYMHPRPCAEQYADKKLVCDKCNNWRQSSTAGVFKCLCVCHPPNNADVCFVQAVKGVSDK